MRVTLSGASWVAITIAILLSSRAFAQNTPQQPPTPETTPQAPSDPASDANLDRLSPEERTQLARQHFQNGVRFFSDHNYREAVREFHLAARATPSADIWFNIARAHEEMNELDEAIEHYQLYLRDRVDPPDRDQVEQRIAGLRERADAERQARRDRPTEGTLRVRSNVDGAAVQLRGSAVGNTPIEAPLSLPAGRHPLSVRSQGYIPFQSEIKVEPGVATAAYVELTPRTEYRAIRGDRIFCWIAGGLAVAALGVSIGLGVEASSRQDESLSDAREYAAYSDYALGASIGLGVAAFALYFLEGRSVGTERVTVSGSSSGPASRAGSASAAASAEADAE